MLPYKNSVLTSLSFSENRIYVLHFASSAKIRKSGNSSYVTGDWGVKQIRYKNSDQN